MPLSSTRVALYKHLKELRVAEVQDSVVTSGIVQEVVTGGKPSGLRKVGGVVISPCFA